MAKDYEVFFEHLGISDEEEKKTVLDFVSTLFNIVIELNNNQLNDDIQ